jgi:hypothetical protein
MSSQRAKDVSWNCGYASWNVCSAARTMEVEILKEALNVARIKKPSLQLPSWNARKDGSQ